MKNPWIFRKEKMRFPTCKLGKAHYYKFQDKKNICIHCGFDYDKFMADIKKANTAINKFVDDKEKRKEDEDV